MSLDLNYKPNVFVETASLTEDEWLAWRRKGVGGSDVAAALGLSPYRTARELYYDKIGVVPAVEGEDMPCSNGLNPAYRSCSSVIRISSPQWAQEMSCGNCCEAV